MKETVQRVFLAITLPPQWQERLDNVINALASIRPVHWHPKEKLHLTLFFWSELSAEQLKSIIEITEKHLLTCAPFNIELGDVVLFPTALHPKVIAFDILHNPKLLSFHQQLQAAYTAAHLPVEQRPFKPHISLGYVGHLPKNLPQPLLSSPIVAESMLAQNISLLQSKPAHGQHIYTPLQLFKLY